MPLGGGVGGAGARAERGVHFAAHDESTSTAVFDMIFFFVEWVTLLPFSCPLRRCVLIDVPMSRSRGQLGYYWVGASRNVLTVWRLHSRARWSLLPSRGAADAELVTV